MLEDDVKWTNEKLIKKLGDYTISHSPKKLFCWGQRYLQSLETVQLCRHLKDEMKSFEKAGIDPMTSDDFVAEFKENGSRVFIYYAPEVGFRFFSRRESVNTFLNNELTDKILLIEKGQVSEPKEYIGKYNYRFILDGEVTVEGNQNFEGVEYGDVEDLMQAIIGSLPERAKRFQLQGNRFIFNIFDCIYFEKAPTGLPPEVHFDYYAADKELNEEEIAWVDEYFADYLRTCAFRGYKSAKKLYAYLYSLKDTLPCDIRKYPFIKRRKIRHALVEFLASKNLPFVEVEGEDKDKLGYLDDVLGEKAEGCFLGKTKVNMADGTYKKIKDVQVGDLVLSYNNSTKCIEPKRVLRKFNNGLKPVSEWYSVSHGVLQGSEVPSRQNLYHRLICTKSHKFYNGSDYQGINTLDFCYELNNIFDNYRKQALIGWVLSDGTVDKNDIVILSQKYDTAFWKYTQELFKPFSVNVNRTRISGKGSTMGVLSLRKVYTSDFVNYNNISELIKQMNEVALAFLIMGDGSKDNRGLRIHMESLDEKNLELMKLRIKELTGAISNDKVDKRVSTYGHILHYNQVETDKIFKCVGAYIHPSMCYKFGDRVQEKFISYPQVSQGIIKVPLLKKDYASYTTVKNAGSKNFTAWDIEVEDNHNYFVENVLVHNCIIKAKYAPYISGMRSSRSHRAAMKVKQSVNSMLKNADENQDFDVFITGINPPKSDRIKDMIGALNCSVYINDGEKTYEHVIASVSGIPHDWKRELCAFDKDGNMILNPEYYGKVIAINGLALTYNLKFQHAVLFNKRDLIFKDKDATECTWDKAELEKMIITRGY